MKFLKDSKVIVTGHTGFKGGWLSMCLKKLGANVVGISDCIPTKPNHFEKLQEVNFIKDYRIDITNLQELKKIIIKEKPDLVFHMAAQALVRESYNNPIKTFNTNAIGTANILESLKAIDKKVVIILITSDKAYDNVEWKWGYRETDLIGGKDPYSASKGMAELVIKSYLNSYFSKNDNVSLGIARAGNVIGGGDWAKDRIVPDCVRAWASNKAVDIRNPHATRPWQHVLEPLSGYLALAKELSSNNDLHGEAYNFGPPANQNYSVQNLIEEMRKYWKNIAWNDISQNEKLHEANLLKLNCDKALHDLGWEPTLDFEETVMLTSEWYRKYYTAANSSEVFQITSSQIDFYWKLAKDRNNAWI